MSQAPTTALQPRSGALAAFGAGQRSRRLAAGLVALGLAAGGAWGEAWGQESPVDVGAVEESLLPVFTTSYYRAASIIDGHSLSHVQGAININMAAGSSNLQHNAGAIALGDNALAHHIVVQMVSANQRIEPEMASAEIKDRALSRAVGWISVNQAAGQQNVQSNTLGVALGIRGSALTSQTLGQVLSRTQEPTDETESASTSRRVVIDESVLAGSRGVIQLNQSAGKGNVTGNRVGMRMTGGVR